MVPAAIATDGSPKRSQKPSGGARAVSFTQTIKDHVETQADVNSCSGATGTSTMHINNAVLHLTVNLNGFCATSTSQGDVLVHARVLELAA
jgi:hypothetical protein